MKKLYFKYGAMGSSKSAQALMTAFNYSQKGYSVFLAKPKIDTRDGNKIKSRIGLSATCTLFDRDQNLAALIRAHANVNVVIIDEAQFCTTKQIEELKELTLDNYVVLCYGLLTNFKCELFEGSRRLVELAESLQEIKSVCRCGKKATMNARIVNNIVTTEGSEIEIGADERYEGMCYECFLKHQKIPVE